MSSVAKIGGIEILDGVNGAGTFIPRFSRTNSSGTARSRDGCLMVLTKCA
jgi:hypothetical protein